MSERLAELSRAVRDSTLKRLRQVPPGHENWRLSRDALSFADIARHFLWKDAVHARTLARQLISEVKAKVEERMWRYPLTGTHQKRRH